MTYREAFDETGRRRIFAKRTADRVVNAVLVAGCIAVLLVLSSGVLG